MALANALASDRDPKSLYQECLRIYIGKLNYKVSSLDSVNQLRFLPPEVLIDIYVMMSFNNNLNDMLYEQLSDLAIFARLLRFEAARQKLFHCMTTLIEDKKPLQHQITIKFLKRYQRQRKSANRPPTTFTKSGQRLSAALTSLTKAQLQALSVTSDYRLPNMYVSTPLHIPALRVREEGAGLIYEGIWSAEDVNEQIEKEQLKEEEEVLSQVADLFDVDKESLLDTVPIDFGLRLGSFLAEAGWMNESIKVLECIAAELRTRRQTRDMLIVRLDCLQRLLHAEAALCSFKEAERTFDEIVELFKFLDPHSVPRTLLAKTYTQFSAMYFARSEYDNSHLWSVVAMYQLQDSTPQRVVIDTLRQAAKACVIMRDFQRANVLICNAIDRAKKLFGCNNQKYADTLLDYGFFLLNVDSVFHSVTMYKQALDIRCKVFGHRNFHVAIAHEDLSYAYYVHEYSTGNFTCAREHVEKAVDIMKYLVPSNHLMLASAKRVKALLLEEIALDKISDSGRDENEMLRQSEDLHKFALHLSLDVFGEVNVQTAKHYGNLGRLYQSMNRFEEAERMHQKAIKIKTDLLGPYDFEVGLSIGHLASLYNYQMNKFREAEELYIRSIEISLRLFGNSYTGLEYDYLGLCHVYEILGEFEKYVKYANILERWQILRSENIAMQKVSYPAVEDMSTLKDLQMQFFTMSTEVPSITNNMDA